MFASTEPTPQTIPAPQTDPAPQAQNDLIQGPNTVDEDGNSLERREESSRPPFQSPALRKVQFKSEYKEDPRVRAQREAQTLLQFYKQFIDARVGRDAMDLIEAYTMARALSVSVFS